MALLGRMEGVAKRNESIEINELRLMYANLVRTLHESLFVKAAVPAEAWAQFLTTLDKPALPAEGELPKEPL